MINVPRTARSILGAWWWTVDRIMLAALIVLMLGGVILSLAASPPVANRIGLDAFHFFNRHALFLLPAIVVLVATSLQSPRQAREQPVAENEEEQPADALADRHAVGHGHRPAVDDGRILDREHLEFPDLLELLHQLQRAGGKRREID